MQTYARSCRWCESRLLTYGFAEDAQIRALDARADGMWMNFRVAREGAAELDVALNSAGFA